MKITEFDFILPEDRIAERPLKERAGSRLLVLHRSGEIEHRQFSDLPSFLAEGDMLILNNTKVFPAKLIGTKENGDKLEILLVRRLDNEEWEVLSKGKFTGSLTVSEELRADVCKGSSARFQCSGDLMDVLRKCGSMPIPPYMKRTPDESDRETYQTVFAKKEGSIAAPTAGLHFTDTLLRDVRARGVKVREVTLHVGVGTFKPIRVDNIEEHSMDSEYFEIDKELLSEIEEVKASGKRVVTVGTTTTRALEGFMSGGSTATSRNGRFEGGTDIFIYPGYVFKAVDSLVTNFHLPRSTPLMLACSLAGREKLFTAYADAVAKGYRFLSYGDAMLIL
jgi:S-adenosylmethionine:tRNA ribosyltransferase-isomerase